MTTTKLLSLAGLLALGALLFACNKQEEITSSNITQEEVIVVDLPKAEQAANNILGSLKNALPNLRSSTLRSSSPTNDDLESCDKLIGELNGHTLLMLSALGFSEDELTGITKEYKPEDIIPLGLALTELYVKQKEESELRSSVATCAMAALGLDLIKSFRSEMGTLTWEGLERVCQSPAGKRFARQAFKKVASKALGPVSLAIAAGEFALCLLGVDIF